MRLPAEGGSDCSLGSGHSGRHSPIEGAGNLAGQGAAPADDDAFQRIALLAATMGADELLTLDAEAVLRRLFWEEPLQRLAPLVGDHAPHFACTCSRERVGRMLRGLGLPEVESIVAEQGRVEIGCDFCGRKYHFDPVDVGELFVAPQDQAPGSSAIN